MIFIGPTRLAGIGQHCSKYTALFPDATYHVIGSEIPESEHGLLFAIPMTQVLDQIPYIKSRVKNLALMTVCETMEVHEDYGLLFEHFKRVAVPSEFCQEVFSRQFPDTEFYVVHAHLSTPDTYTFYHIGNIIDDRKQFNGILEAFVRLNEPKSRLLVKATCVKDVQVKLPRVEIINGLISDEDMEHWGKPDPVKLLEFMRDAFEKRLRYMDHTHTKNLVGRDAVLHEFFTDVIGGQDEKTHE
jgi:hypothetical protein